MANIPVLAKEELNSVLITQIWSSSVLVQVLINKYYFVISTSRKQWFQMLGCIFSYLSHEYLRMHSTAEGTGPESGNLCSSLSSALVLFPTPPSLPYVVWEENVSLVIAFCGSGDSGNWESGYFLAWRGICTLCQMRGESLVPCTYFWLKLILMPLGEELDYDCCVLYYHWLCVCLCMNI